MVHVDRIDLLARPAGTLRELIAIRKHLIETLADELYAYRRGRVPGDVHGELPFERMEIHEPTGRRRAKQSDQVWSYSRLCGAAAQRLPAWATSCPSPIITLDVCVT